MDENKSNQDMSNSDLHHTFKQRFGSIEAGYRQVLPQNFTAMTTKSRSLESWGRKKSEPVT